MRAEWGNEGSAGRSPAPSFLRSAWHLWLDAVPRPGWANMAIDQALLDLAGSDNLGCLRLYRWAPHCLSFGRHEPALRLYDRHRIEALGLDRVRRPTGGRAVWHARELTYAVAAPARLGSLAATYRAIHETLADALRQLGAEPSLAAAPPRAAALDAGACFAIPAGGEVMVAGRKVIGSAQLRQGGAFLQHGSVLLEDDQETVRLIRRQPAAAGQDAPLSALLGRIVSFDETAHAVAGAARNWPGTWTRLSDPEPILRRAAVHTGRFRDDAWTWRR